MAAYLLAMKWVTGDVYGVDDVSHFTQLLLLALLVGGGAAVYAAGVVLTGVVRIGDIKRYFGRGGS